MKSFQYSGRGISQEQAQALQKSNETLILEFAHSKDHVWTALRAANALVEEMARKGAVWRGMKRRVKSFSPIPDIMKRLESWTAEVADVSRQTIVHIYSKKDECVRAITLGMSKLGLPDAVIDDSSWSSGDQAGILINLFCQTMAESQVFRKIGASQLDLRAIKNSAVRDNQMSSFKANASAMACLTSAECPFPSLHAGEVVAVRQEDAFDYIRQYADKRTERNTTGDIIRKMNEHTATSCTRTLVTPCRAD